MQGILSALFLEHRGEGEVFVQSITAEDLLGEGELIGGGEGGG